MRNLQVGDIVLIQDKNVLRGKWKLGVVVEALASNDGTVRNVSVQYTNVSTDGTKDKLLENSSKEIVKRPVQKLVVVKAVDEDDNDES